MSETTPMMKQYYDIKKKHKDTVLFFRLGDFYEMFQKDALEISALLGLTLTHRNGVPMCGLPYHAAQTYIARLLRAGKKIAICEQIKLSKPGKGIAEREVIEILSPGTIVDEDLLDGRSNNYLISIGRIRDSVSLAWTDLSTGELAACSFPWNERIERIRKEFARLAPREVLIQESLYSDGTAFARLFDERNDLTVNRFPDWLFDLESSRGKLKNLFGVENLKGFGIPDESIDIFACGVLIEYLEDSSRQVLTHFKTVRIVHEEDFMGLDESTQKNLELLENLQDASKRYSLLGIIDATRTTMGARLMKKWILHPLTDSEMVNCRLDPVETLYHDQQLLSGLRKELGNLLDVERLSSRVALEKAHAKDLLGIGASLEAYARILCLINGIIMPSAALTEQESELVTLCSGLIRRSIQEDPSVLLTEGNLIKEGYSSELDDLRIMKANGRKILDEYVEQERSGAGISSLRIKYNRIIGYYIEVTKSNLNNVPSHFIRRQSIVGGERFTTDRLIELEANLNTASEKIIELEKSIFLEIRAKVKECVPALLSLCAVISEIDCFQSHAYTATRFGYTRPVIDTSSCLKIKGGRHPVVEAHLPPGQFVPNGIELEGRGVSFALITGPNMAGKSTFLRQTALIVLMAQIGSFVPADSAHIGIVDKIFCRVGASDNLARGESTFLVEMNETAYILRTATERSLVIMDEVGRGTGTNDGLSIAWAVTEYLLGKEGIKTLFATHYHELTSIEHPSICNLSMDVLENEGEIVFLKKVRNGPSNNSYGLHVARLAGLPREVLKRAEEVLASIVHSEGSFPAAGGMKPIEKSSQGLLFDPLELLSRQICSLDLDSLKPIDALNMIAIWQDELKDRS